LKDDNGFGLGTAASSARPQALDHPAGLSGNMSANVEGNIGISNNATIVGAADNNQIQDQTIPADKNKAYSMFKESIAPDLRDELARLNAIVRGVKDNVRTNTSAINMSTEDIRKYGAILEQKKTERLQRGEGSDVIDEEEFATIKANKKARAAYRAQLEELKKLKGKLALAKEKALQAKSILLDRFEEWYTANGGGTEEDDLTNGPENGQDDLDYGEQFEALERERVRNSDPESLAFFNSRKMMAQTKRATKSGTLHAMAKKRSMRK